jgi:asparagine synthase (glutamine-hydrolysing)
MAHSVELRTPLVDSTLLGHLAAIDRQAHSGKALLARAPSQPLPETLLSRDKTGFVTPVAAWMASRVGKAPSDRRAPPSRLSTRAWSRTVHARFPFSA